MKKIIKIMTCCFALMLISACGKTDNLTEDKFVTEAENTEETVVASPPELSQIRAICELATLECSFHNVAKSNKEKGTGLVHLGETERVFWIEYTGVTKIGIDMSKVEMEVEDTTIIITLPEAEIMSCEVTDEIDENHYISSNDGILNKNPITAKDQTDAVAKAQEDMKERVLNDSVLMKRAQDRAKTLIENYITKLGEATGVDYTVQFEYANKVPDEYQ